jgi:outer membrane biosynthesis protein TonB
MSLTRDEIVRDAADRVGSIVEAAEKKAAEIEADARDEADRIVGAARREAKEQVDRAQGAVSRLVEQADELRSAVGRLGSDITSQVGSSKSEPKPKAETPAPEVVPQPPRIPEPEPPLEPEPSPPQTPEPQPPIEPEPSPPSVPEPQPPGPEIGSGAASTEDLLAQLKGDKASPEPAAGSNGGAANAAGTEPDVAAARLVAMKMALEGASRDEIATHLGDNYELSHPDKLLDDVLARAKP